MGGLCQGFVFAVLAAQKSAIDQSFDGSFLATERCLLDFGSLENKRIKLTARFVDIQTKIEKRRLEFDLAYDPDQPIKVNQVSSAYDRYYPVYLTEGLTLKKVGDQQHTLNLDFEFDKPIHASGGITQLNENKDGQFGFQNDDPPSGFYCTDLPVSLPVQYGRWLEMRKADREIAERHYYRGKTLEELMIEVQKRPEFDWR
jgi:hypothetical protein